MNQNRAAVEKKQEPLANMANTENLSAKRQLERLRRNVADVKNAIWWSGRDYVAISRAQQPNLYHH